MLFHVNITTYITYSDAIFYSYLIFPFSYAVTGVSTLLDPGEMEDTRGGPGVGRRGFHRY